jgi:hypothetical protein
MGVNIQITDGKNASTVIGSGSRPPKPIVAAGQIVGWTEQKLVIRGGSFFKEKPFAVGWWRLPFRHWQLVLFRRC